MVLEKKIGIWGFGTVGKSVLRHFANKNLPVSVYDQKRLRDKEKQIINAKNIPLFEPNQLTNFLHNNEIIIPSPGVDLRNFQQFKNKWLAEVDLFAQYWKKPVIAITGTLGKTTITKILESILQKHIVVKAAGNIGIPMFDQLDYQNEYNALILELSSFQLEQAKTFAPDLAIITNIYPNHFDRHGSMIEYVQAKMNIVNHQLNNQQALVPLELKKIIKPHTKAHLSFFSIRPCSTAIKQLRSHETLFYIENDIIIKLQDNKKTILINIKEVPTISFKQNWLVIIGTCSLLDIPITSHLFSDPFELPAYRLEKIATVNGVTFYNDSKSTIIESTVAAVEQLSGKPIHLLIGGISKGVDRIETIKKLKQQVKHLYFFGSEAYELEQQISKSEQNYFAFETLEDAFEVIVQNIEPGDQVLFSPGGASFDLFTNFEERGKCFKELVYTYKETGPHIMKTCA